MEVPPTLKFIRQSEDRPFGVVRLRATEMERRSSCSGVGRRQIRAGVERMQDLWEYRMQDLWEYFVEIPHLGYVELDGDSAAGRVSVSELGHMRDGRSELNHALYHDRHHRTPNGWKFPERIYEVRYLDRTLLSGSAPVRDSVAT